MNLTRRTARRAVATMLTATATTVALATTGAPAAHAGTLGDADLDLVLVTPDPANMLAACTTTMRMSNRLGGRPTLSETGAVSISSSGCGTVRWTATMTILDESPGHPTRAVSNTGPAGNPSSASASQNVTYGLGVREAGVISFQFEASSRLGTLCFVNRYSFDSATWTIMPLGRAACDLGAPSPGQVDLFERAVRVMIG